MAFFFSICFVTNFIALNIYIYGDGVYVEIAISVWREGGAR